MNSQNEDIAARWRKQHDDATQRLRESLGGKIVSSDLGTLHDAEQVAANAQQIDGQITAALAVGDRRTAGRLRIMKANLQPLPAPPEPAEGSDIAIIAEQHAVPGHLRHLLMDQSPDEIRRRIDQLAAAGLARKTPTSRKS